MSHTQIKRPLYSITTSATLPPEIVVYILAHCEEEDCAAWRCTSKKNTVFRNIHKRQDKREKLIASAILRADSKALEECYCSVREAHTVYFSAIRTPEKKSARKFLLEL